MNHRCPTEAKLPTHCGSEAKPHSSLCDDFPSLLSFAPQNGNHLMESSIGEWFGLSAISKKCAKTAIPYTTKYKKISASHDEIRLLQMIMNTGLHFAEDTIMILAACCLR